MQQERLARSLGFLGLIPFYGFLLAFACLEDYPRSLSVQGFVIYSLAILSFMAGALWGAAKTSEGVGANLTLLVSNGVVIFSVISLLTAQAMLAACLLALGFLALLWYERNISGERGWYARMRLQLTLLVVLAHGVYVALHIVGA